MAGPLALRPALYLKTQNYHWNVTGPMFNTLHTLFMTEYTELALAVDEIAERIRAAGGLPSVHSAVEPVEQWRVATRSKGMSLEELEGLADGAAAFPFLLDGAPVSVVVEEAIERLDVADSG